MLELHDTPDSRGNKTTPDSPAEPEPTLTPIRTVTETMRIADSLLDIRQSLRRETSTLRLDPELLTDEARQRLAILGEALIMVLRDTTVLLEELHEIGVIKLEQDELNSFIPQVGSSAAQNTTVIELVPEPEHETPTPHRESKKGMRLEFGLGIGGEEYDLTLHHPHQAFILEMLAAMKPGTIFNRANVLDNGFYAEGTRSARPQAFKKAIGEVAQALELSTDRPLIEPIGIKGGRRYCLQEKIEIKERPEAVNYVLPEQWKLGIPKKKARTKTRRSVRKTAVRRAARTPAPRPQAKPAAPPPTEAPQPEPDSDTPDPTFYHPRMLRSLEIETDEASLQLRNNLRETFAQKLGIDLSAPHRTRPLLSVSDKVITAHFGLNGSKMMEIEEVSRQLDHNGTLTPAAVRYLIRERLKELRSEPGAQAYLEYLDSQ